MALLNANYIAKRLAPHYATLYTPAATVWWRTVHPRPAPRSRDATGISAEDVAKRLIDFGFPRSPLLSFPVAGTLMVEPTERIKHETRSLHRRDDADPREIRAIEDGKLDREDNR